MAFDTSAYTPGTSSCPHPMPQEVIPDKTKLFGRKKRKKKHLWINLYNFLCQNYKTDNKVKD